MLGLYLVKLLVWHDKYSSSFSLIIKIVLPTQNIAYLRYASFNFTHLERIPFAPEQEDMKYSHNVCLQVYKGRFPASWLFRFGITFRL